LAKLNRTYSRNSTSSWDFERLDADIYLEFLEFGGMAESSSKFPLHEAARDGGSKYRKYPASLSRQRLTRE
jgi:hypothetical protein